VPSADAADLAKQAHEQMIDTLRRTTGINVLLMQTTERSSDRAMATGGPGAEASLELGKHLGPPWYVERATQGSQQIVVARPKGHRTRYGDLQPSESLPALEEVP